MKIEGTAADDDIYLEYKEAGKAAADGALEAHDKTYIWHTNTGTIFYYLHRFGCYNTSKRAMRFCRSSLPER